MAGELEHEAELTREEAATYFEEVADGLRSNEAFTVVLGDVEVDIDPAETLEFEVELEDGEDEREFEIEMEWPRGDEELEIDAEE
jgi:amphi-Trp domain-containing protein